MSSDFVAEIEHILAWIVQFVEHFGYLGIFIMTFLESTFVPVPSEVTMVPAGYLISQGKMNPGLVFMWSVAGTILGSLFNYWIAARWGRTLFIRYGKYFFMNEQRLHKMEEFFIEHGPISIFSGRLIPGIRHYISFPAGLARMSLKKFCIYTAAGGAIWMMVLISLGYFIGQNEELLHHYMRVITLSVVGIVVLLGGLYVWNARRNRRKNAPQS